MATNHLLRNTQLGGHAWVFLNWALGFRALGCDVVFLEQLGPRTAVKALPAQLDRMRIELRQLGLEAEFTFALKPEQEQLFAPIRDELDRVARPLAAVADECDVLLNFRYLLPEQFVRRFKRTALVDIDPGLLQCWIDSGQLAPAQHDLYFTIGETVGQPHARFGDCGIDWIFSPPVVHLEAWPVQPPPERDAAFTTVTNWWGKYEVLNGETLGNYKRTHFMECLDLPSRIDASIELAIFHESGDASDIELLRKHGFAARPAREVSSTPQQYREFIRRSRGEFSCAKPSCMFLQNAWISDRTLCYLASGRPAVVQDTGPSRILPDAEGLLRFDHVDGAERCLKAVERDYNRHATAARALVEEHFAAERVLPGLLDRVTALPARVNHAQD